MANEHFETVADPATLNVDYNLGVIQKTPTRIVVLNTHARFTVMILKQAARRGMLKNWAWLVTDGSTNTVSSLSPYLGSTLCFRGRCSRNSTNTCHL